MRMGSAEMQKQLPSTVVLYDVPTGQTFYPCVHYVYEGEEVPSELEKAALVVVDLLPDGRTGSVTAASKDVQVSSGTLVPGDDGGVTLHIEGSFAQTGTDGAFKKSPFQLLDDILERNERIKDLLFSEELEGLFFAKPDPPGLDVPPPSSVFTGAPTPPPVRRNSLSSGSRPTTPEIRAGTPNPNQLKREEQKLGAAPSSTRPGSDATNHRRGGSPASTVAADPTPSHHAPLYYDTTPRTHHRHPNQSELAYAGRTHQPQPSDRFSRNYPQDDFGNFADGGITVGGGPSDRVYVQQGNQHDPIYHRANQHDPIYNRANQHDPIHQRANQHDLIYNRAIQHDPIYNRANQHDPIYQRANQTEAFHHRANQNDSLHNRGGQGDQGHFVRGGAHGHPIGPREAAFLEQPMTAQDRQHMDQLWRGPYTRGAPPGTSAGGREDAHAAFSPYRDTAGYGQPQVVPDLAHRAGTLPRMPAQPVAESAFRPSASPQYPHPQRGDWERGQRGTSVHQTSPWGTPRQ